MKTLFKLDNKNQIRQWSVEVSGDKYRFITGILGGKLVESAWTVALPKNIGRANETTGVQQAQLEVDAEIEKKRKKFYFDTPEDARTIAKDFTPMLAGRYSKWQGPSYSQPKLDGIRASASTRGMYSRGNEKIVSVPHIENSLKRIFEEYPALIVDGELYNHAYKDDFNELTSIIKTMKPTDEDIIKAEKNIEFHVYDCYTVGTFETRHKMLHDILTGLPDYIKLVDTDLANDEDQLDIFYTNYLLQGYEGQMVRLPGSLYEQKRSKGLLKRKPLYEGGGNDGEYEIIGFMEGRGNWAGKAKVAILKWPAGGTVDATMKGTMAMGAEIWANQEKYIGKMATMSYQNLTPDGVPRFATVTALDRGNY